MELANKAKQIAPAMKVLFASGYSEEVFLQHGRPDAEDAFIRKPFRRKELAKTVRAVLDKVA